MGTKNNPGDYDCYANAHPDEPMFILLGRDDRAPALVDQWARASEARGTDPKKVAEARRCADAMRWWKAHGVRPAAACPCGPNCTGLCSAPKPASEADIRAVLGIIMDYVDDHFRGEGALTAATVIRLLAELLALRADKADTIDERVRRMEADLTEARKDRDHLLAQLESANDTMGETNDALAEIRAICGAVGHEGAVSAVRLVAADRDEFHKDRDHALDRLEATREERDTAVRKHDRLLGLLRAVPAPEEAPITMAERLWREACLVPFDLTLNGVTARERAIHARDEQWRASLVVTMQAHKATVDRLTAERDAAQRAEVEAKRDRNRAGWDALRAETETLAQRNAAGARGRELHHVLGGANGESVLGAAVRLSESVKRWASATEALRSTETNEGLDVACDRLADAVDALLEQAKRIDLTGLAPTETKPDTREAAPKPTDEQVEAEARRLFSIWHNAPPATAFTWHNVPDSHRDSFRAIARDVLGKRGAK
jgi:hypothetical protein